MLSVAVPAHAQSEEEKKALERIHKKAAAEKKKALEKIRKKAEEDKKKTEAKEKTAAAKKQKDDAEAKKKAERERAKEPKKEEPPPPAAAPPPPPAEPPPPPPPAVEPAAAPVETVGTARFTGVGFVQPGETPPGAGGAAAAGVQIPGIANLDSLTVLGLRLGASRATFNPINDDRTDDDTAFSLVDFDFGVNAEFRNVGQLLVPWFDVDLGILFGKRREELAETGCVFSAFANRISGLFGLDLAAGDFLSGGPFVGYCRDVLRVAADRREPGHLRHRVSPWSPVRAPRAGQDPSQAQGAVDVLRRRTLRMAQASTRPRTTPRFRPGCGRASSTSRAGTRRDSGSSGSFSLSDFSDATDQNSLIASATAASFPIEQRLGGGLMIPFLKQEAKAWNTASRES